MQDNSGGRDPLGVVTPGRDLTADSAGTPELAGSASSVEVGAGTCSFLEWDHVEMNFRIYDTIEGLLESTTMYHKSGGMWLRR